MLGARADRVEDESLGELFGQLVDDARQVVRSEANVYRETVQQRIRAARTPIILLLVALILIFAAVGTFVVMIAVALTPAIGPFGAGAAVSAATLLVAGLAAWLGAKGLGNAATGRGVADQ